ncbi:hypothetical protein C7C56_014090, partial [Massilia glaciei]
MPAPRLPAHLPGIDLADGLRRCRDNAPLYHDLLVMFHRRFADAPAHLGQLCREARYDEAAVFTHTLRGTAANLGAHALGAATARLEQAVAGRRD